TNVRTLTVTSGFDTTLENQGSLQILGANVGGFFSVLNHGNLIVTGNVSAGSVDLVGVTGLTVAPSAQIVANNGDLDLTTGTGNLTANDGDVRITAVGQSAVIVNVTATADVRLIAGGNLLLGGLIDAGNLVTLISGGSIVDMNGTGLNVTANDLVATAAG